MTETSRPPIAPPIRLIGAITATRLHSTLPENDRNAAAETLTAIDSSCLSALTLVNGSVAEQPEHGDEHDPQPGAEVPAVDRGRADSGELEHPVVGALAPEQPLAQRHLHGEQDAGGDDQVRHDARNTASLLSTSRIEPARPQIALRRSAGRAPCRRAGAGRRAAPTCRPCSRGTTTRCSSRWPAPPARRRRSSPGTRSACPRRRWRSPHRHRRPPPRRPGRHRPRGPLSASGASR